MRRFITALVSTLLPVAALAVAAEDRPAPPVDAGIHTYILLDRTGSMSSIWEEAVSSVNAYARALGDNSDGASIEPMITVAAFDHHNGFQFDALRRKVRSPGWADLATSEASPRGTTPLYDAIGRMVTMAEMDAPERAVIVIMTDGLENASEEFTRQTAKAALDRAEDRGWEIIFLGAEFAKFDDADRIGVASEKQMAISKDRLQMSMGSLGRKVRNYAQEAAPAPLEFTDEERAEAGEDEVKDRSDGN